MPNKLCRLRGPGALVLALAMAASGAGAFEAWEHERLGNLAFHLARQIHCQANPQRPPCDQLAAHIFDPLDPEPTGNGAHLSYGMVSRCVDFFLTPEKMIAGHEDRIFFGGKDYKPRAQLGGAVPRNPADYFGINWSKHCEDVLFNPAATHAAHSNHAHFQAELVTSQHLYHFLAINISRDGNPFGALFINGIADHYLNDFFAPGHIATFRSHMSDIYSNAVHDSINHGGARLRFKPADYQALLDRIDARDRLLDDDSRRYLLQANWSPLGKNASDSDTCHGGCDPLPADEERWLAGVHTIADLLARPLAQSRPDAEANGDHHIRLRGDRQLWRASQWHQRLLMLALQTQSVLDVLRAFPGASGATTAAAANTFNEPMWRAERLGEDDGAEIEATLDGRFRYRMHFLHGDALPWLPFARREPDPEIDGKADVVEVAGLRQSYLWLRPKGRHQLVLSLGINHEMPRFGRMQQRESVSLETPLLGYLRTGPLKVSFGLAGGVFYFSEKRRSGEGVSLRPGFVMSQSETFFSMPLRWFHYRQGIDRRSKYGWGLRVDQGFSSFFTVYLELNRSYFLQDDKTFQRGSVFGAGVVFAAPFCRIPLLGRTCYE